jgi:hypothetical protein
VREPANPDDQNAVAVHNKLGDRVRRLVHSSHSPHFVHFAACRTLATACLLYGGMVMAHYSLQAREAGCPPVSGQLKASTPCTYS